MRGKGVSMPFSKEQQDRIGAFLVEQGVQGCVACGFDGAFLYGDVVTLPTGMEPEPPDYIHLVGHQVVPIACPRCGYVMLFDAKNLPI